MAQERRQYLRVRAPLSIRIINNRNDVCQTETKDISPLGLRFEAKEAMLEIARFLHVPESTVYGVSTFYAQFKLTPLGRQIVRICRGTACHVRGGAKILEEVEKQLGIKAGETTEDLEYTLETIACFGSCALAPVMVIDKDVHGRMTTSKVKSVLSGTE